MKINIITWIGFGLSFAATFLFSLLYMSLCSFSKISISRLLEDKGKEYRLKILEIYDELKVFIEIMRVIFLIAFLVYLYIIFPRPKIWPLWLFLISLAVYLIFFDLFPRLINSFSNKKILTLFLPSFKMSYAFSLFLPLLKKMKSLKKEQDVQHEASEEEIQALIEEAKEEGIIEKEEETLLKSIVEFGDTIVREIMTPRVDIICIRKDTSIKKLRTLVIKEKHSRIPVYKERIDNIEGIVIAKDLLEYSDDRHNSDAIESLIRPVYFIPESMKVAELLKEFQKRKQKLAIVVDEHGGVSGLVTMEDLMEEIVGEIQDEYDKDKVQFIEQKPFDYIVLGDAEVEELEDIFDLDLSQDDYITVGGLITHYLGRLPKQGEHIKIKGLSLEILDVDQKKVKKLRIKKILQSDQEE